ncbi:MAG TPA: MbcA/ParS/Xre antitoxin family protein [Stenotrophomonas sp.]|nr:MbcA/ParS/Xre antitoxin family protein [Stenotrophomonas sp.]
MNQTVAPAPSRRDLSGPALRTFFNITRAWGLAADQERVLLGDPSRSTFFRWRAGPDGAELGKDVLDRISYVLGIYKALHMIFPNDEQADGWIKRANTAPGFNGRSALERMLGGQVIDLFAVREYLDAERGWN